MRGQDFGFIDDFLDAHHDRCAADDRRPAAVCIAAIMRHRCIAPHDDDVLGGDAELVGGNLGEAGFLALAVRRRAGDDRNLA